MVVLPPLDVPSSSLFMLLLLLAHAMYAKKKRAWLCSVVSVCVHNTTNVGGKEVFEHTIGNLRIAISLGSIGLWSRLRTRHAMWEGFCACIRYFWRMAASRQLFFSQVQTIFHIDYYKVHNHQPNQLIS
ncbi:hypothetical protein BC939DRAFT_192085 [Gamsiella multidivaricata]|uniref:uncharacterized protein n=1 Tax=Gamsiella multidivaricata TaxID=101098 RepID=UPI00221FCAD6|nr:uncharacterized protein BC939DRAFT_192085 [Gamsiella multidivaricata]KAI7822148.1 hypothetical protein BC939DRAFT_192085 [Gamsiella multidivaricata]